MTDGCRELWTAVLGQALKDAQIEIDDPEKQQELVRIRDRARSYIDKRLGTFDFACNALDLDPEKTSKRMEWEYQWRMNGGD